jgi:hypothetical protein
VGEIIGGLEQAFRTFVTERRAPFSGCSSENASAYSPAMTFVTKPATRGGTYAVLCAYRLAASAKPFVARGSGDWALC